MTPVQLPEVPAIARFNVTGDYCYPTVDDQEGACVSYDDHVAQLREYATEAVMVERSSRDPLIEKALRIFLNTSRVAEWLQQGRNHHGIDAAGKTTNPIGDQQ